MQALRDLRDAVRTMPGPFRQAFWLILCVTLLQSGLGWLAPEPEQQAGAVVRAAGVALGLATALVLTPIEIAVHRHILLGEVAPAYRFGFEQPRARRFLALATMLLVVNEAAALVLATLAPQAAVLAVAALGLYVFVIRFGLRTLVMFPAIAVDGEGADLPSNRAATRGRLWFIAWNSLKGFAPTWLAVLALVAVALVAPAGWRSPEMLIVLSPLAAAFSLLAATNHAVVAARLYADLRGVSAV